MERARGVAPVPGGAEFFPPCGQRRRGGAVRGGTQQQRTCCGGYYLPPATCLSVGLSVKHSQNIKTQDSPDSVWLKIFVCSECLCRKRVRHDGETSFKSHSSEGMKNEGEIKTIWKRFFFSTEEAQLFLRGEGNTCKHDKINRGGAPRKHTI